MTPTAKYNCSPKYYSPSICPSPGTSKLHEQFHFVFVESFLPIDTLSVLGAYDVRTSSLNDKHSCQLFRMGLRDKSTPTLTSPLIRDNMSCAVATIFSSLFLFLRLSPWPT